MALLCVVGINANAVQKTVFSFDVTATGDVATANPAVAGVEDLSSNSTVSGGTVSYYQAQGSTSSAVKYIVAETVEGTKKSDLRFTVKESYMIVTLANGEQLKAGDVISFTTWGTKNESQMCFTEVSAASRALTYSTTAGSYTVQESDAICGLSTFKVWRYESSKVLYFNNLTITREVAGGTSIAVNTSSAVIYALNSTTPEGQLPTAIGTSSATWEGTDYSFSLTGASASESLRDLNNSTAARQIVIDETSYRPILVNKGGNGVYNITKSANIKSVKLYAKCNFTSEKDVTIIFDFGITGKETSATKLPLLEETAAEFDVTDKTNIRVSDGTAIAFAIEYESGANVTVADINWASLYLPVAVTIPEGVKAYYASNVSSTSVTLTEITDAIPANTGVVINAEADTYTFPIATTEVEALGEGVNKFDGVVADTPCTARTAYVLSGANDAKTAPKFGLYTGTTLGAYKAYLDKEANNLGDALTLDFVIGEPTAIGSIEAAAHAAQVKKYILNGAIIVEKDGKKYNAAGAQVK